jgi:hypothetical protein
MGVTLEATAQFIADALAPLRTDLTDLQIEPFLLPWPTPPAIDIYPSFAFMAPHAQGLRQTTWTVRARAQTADHVAGQQDLYRLMEPDKVWELLRTMGDATVNVLNVTGPSGFLEYFEPVSRTEKLVGCEWEVTVVTEV